MTVNWQLELAATCPPQADVNVNPGEAVAEISGIALDVGLLSVNTCGAADVPTVAVPKLALAGASVGASTEAAVPIPVKPREIDPLDATIVKAPLYACASVGAKTTASWQVELPASWVPQVEV